MVAGQQINHLLFDQTNLNSLLFIPVKQIHLVKTKFLHLERQWEIAGTFEQKIVSRLLAVTQTFNTQRVELLIFHWSLHDMLIPAF